MLGENELEPGEQALDLRPRVRRQRFAEAGPQLVQPAPAALEKWIVVACAQRRQHSTDSVDQTDPLGNQFATFPDSPPRIFIGLVRDRHHRTDAGLTTKPSQQRAQEQLGVRPARARPP